MIDIIQIFSDYYAATHPIDFAAQMCVFITGISAIHLLSYAESAKMRMYGGLMGLAGEPFWLITTIYKEQWPIVILCVAYGFNWYRVFRNNRKVYLKELENN